MALVRKDLDMSSMAGMVTTVIIYPHLVLFALRVPLYTSSTGTSDPLGKFRRRRGGRCGGGRGRGVSYLYLQWEKQGSESLLHLPRVRGGYFGQVGIERG